MAGNRPPLSETSPSTVQKRAAEGVNTRDPVERRFGATNRANLGTGLKVTSSNEVTPSNGVGRAEEDSVQEEIDRLQKRVKDKLAQWESRYERGVENGNLYSVNNRDKSPAPGSHPSKAGIHNEGASSVKSSSLPSSPAVVSSLGLESSSSRSGLGSGLGTNGKPESGRRTENGTAPESSRRETDAAVGGLWAMEAPTTGRVNWALRTGAFCMVLIPPVGVASQYPDAFIQASNLAVRPPFELSSFPPSVGLNFFSLVFRLLSYGFLSCSSS